MSTNVVTPKINGTAPAVATTKTPLSDLWIMHYYKSGKPNQTKNFTHSGDFKAAHELAKKYCTKMGYRLMFIKSFLSDLDAEMNASNDLQNPS